MNNVITVDFKNKTKLYSADIYTHDMCKYQLETEALNVHDACLNIVSTSKRSKIKCVVIYLGLLIDRNDNEDATLTYFTTKEVCNE